MYFLLPGALTFVTAAQPAYEQKDKNTISLYFIMGIIKLQRCCSDCFINWGWPSCGLMVFNEMILKRKPWT